MKGKSKDTNPRGPVDGKYIRNISADDDFRLRLPKKLVQQLRLDQVKKVAISVNEIGHMMIEPYLIIEDK